MLTETNILVNGKKLNMTDKELTYMLMVINMLEHGRKVSGMEKEPS